jgi:3-dehydroquinate synthase
MNSLKELDSAGNYFIADVYFKDKIKLTSSKVLFIEASEDLKNLQTCEEVLKFLRSMGCKKENQLIALGGGIIQDIGAFVASVYMRGIEWIFIPTTLVTMMDSCIGGKSSINIDGYKNIVGNFYPPKQILIDVNFCNSLSGSDISSGLLEGIKICFAKSSDDFIQFQHQLNQSQKIPNSNLLRLIQHTLRCKKWFIETDEFDVAERKLLNFGHTFGHAIETSSKYEIPHGVAIGIGMLAAITHPAAIKSVTTNLLKREIHSILRNTKNEFKGLLLDLPHEDFLKAFESDKKHGKNVFNLVLPSYVRVQLIEIAKNDESASVIWDSLMFAIEELYE